ADAAKAIRDANPIPVTTGSVDVYPFKLSVPIAYGLLYNPRPVFQSYSACTPLLAQMNAAHLRSPRGPHSILFDVQAIDNRLPALEDGLSWPLLLTQYNLTDASGAFLLLQRAARPRAFQLEPLAHLTVGLGSPIAVPDFGAEAIWATVDIEPTLLGRV